MVKNHQSVDWYAYFKSIREQCPWSYSAYLAGKIMITEYQGQRLPLGDYAARMYIVHAPPETVIALADMMDRADRDCEWLYSYPGYGEYATPVSVLIQQDRKTLAELRAKHGE